MDSAPRRAVPPSRLPPRAVQARHADGRGDGPDVLVAGQLADAAPRRGGRRGRLRAVLPAGQAIRKTALRDRDRERARRARGGPRGDGAGAAVLPPAAVHAPERRRRRRRAAGGRSAGAGGGAAVRPSRHAAARDGGDAADAPHGLRHRLGRRPAGAARRGRVHARRLRRLRGRVHPAHRRRAAARAGGLPAGGSGAGGGGAGGGGGAAGAAQLDPDGRADRHAPQPDPGQPLRRQQAAALVRDEPAARCARAAIRAAAAASIRDSSSTRASSP